MSSLRRTKVKLCYQALELLCVKVGNKAFAEHLNDVDTGHGILKCCGI